MGSLKIKRLVVTSFAKIFALYSLFVAIIMSVIDIIQGLFTGTTQFTGASGITGGWFIYAIAFIILSPILGYVVGLIMGFLLNLAMKVGSGLELEVE